VCREIFPVSVGGAFLLVRKGRSAVWAIVEMGGVLCRDVLRGTRVHGTARIELLAVREQGTLERGVRVRKIWLLVGGF